MRDATSIRHRPDILNSLYAGLFCAAPMLSGRAVEVAGLRLLVGAGAILLAYGLLDIINERHGAAQARRTVVGAAVARFAVWGIAASTAFLPVAWEIPGYSSVVLSSVRVLIAGELSMLASQYIVDIPLFDRLKRVGGSFGLRYNVSTLCSGALSTVLFMTIAFVGTGAPVESLIVSQLLLRALISIVLTPLFLWVLRWV